MSEQDTHDKHAADTGEVQQEANVPAVGTMAPVGAAGVQSAYVQGPDVPVSYDRSSNIEFTRSNSLTNQAWDEEAERAKHQPWNASLGGRLGIRTFSRGLMGATFFAAGSYYARHSLKSFSPYRDPTQPLHYIAAGIDKFVGAPLEKMVTAMGHDGREFVTFRPTKFHYKEVLNGIRPGGATLGHEAVALTFDFASMSVGDSIGRDLAEAADPNVHHSWIDEEGHLNYSAIAKNTVKNSWKYLTYSQGEDWAVSIPYAFYVRGQRNMIDRMSPGFGYDSDRRLNGGSYKVDSAGKITGTYGLEGAMDLQGRFTAYNVGTLMFREAYAETKDVLKNWYASGFKLPQGPATMSDAIEGALGAAGSVSRWALRDTVKATLYMIPSVPAFWMFRSPQHKYRGAFIHPEKGMVSYGTGNAHLQAVKVNETSRTNNMFKPPEDMFSERTPTFFSKSNGCYGATNMGPVTNPFETYGEKAKYVDRMKIDAYGETYGAFDALLNPLGKLNNKMRKKAHKPLYTINDKLGLDLNNEKIAGKHVTDMFVNASFAYTPYFMMKNDVMAYNWDTAKMDMAIERAIDGATHLRGDEFVEGTKEIWASMWHKPFDDPAREVAAQKAICDDKSPADGQNFYANSRCFDHALQDITILSKYHHDANTKRFVDRLQDSRERSHNMMDNFKQEAANKFTNMVTPRKASENNWNMPDTGATYALKEKRRQARSLDDFPDINTTVH